jgi:hypothetical protein
VRRVIRDAGAFGTDVHVTARREPPLAEDSGSNATCRIVGANAVRLSRYRDLGSATWLSCGRVGLRRADAFWRVGVIAGVAQLGA